MITRNTLIDDKKLFLQKSQGCLIGLAVGDAMGDLGRSQEYRNRYGIVTNLHPGAKSTDDTEFGLLTARTLIDCGGNLTAEAVVAAWKKYIIDQGGIFDRAGKPLYGAVANLERGILPPYTGIDNVQNNDDGAAMRVAPIGIICAGQPEKAAEMAALEASVSHYMDGIWAAQAVAASIAVAMVNGTTEEIIAAGMKYIPEDSWLGRSMARAMAICDQAGTIEAAWEDLHTQLWTPVHSVSPEALPQIYSIIKLTDGDFQKGMFWACNFGRDADSVAAIVGAMTAARQSVSVIPDRWVQQVRYASGVSLKFVANEDVLKLAEELVNLVVQD
jgi:ADP-ribosylglycohydrolase